MQFVFLFLDLFLSTMCFHRRRSDTQLGGSATHPEHAGARKEDLPDSRGLLHRHTPDLLHHAVPHPKQQQVVPPGRPVAGAAGAPATATAAVYLAQIG